MPAGRADGITVRVRPTGSAPRAWRRLARVPVVLPRMEAPNPGVLAVASVRVREERHLARGSRCRRPRSERFRTREIGHRVDVAGCARNGTSGDAVTTFGLSVIGEPVSDTGGENPAGGYTGSSIVVSGSAAHLATAPIADPQFRRMGVCIAYGQRVISWSVVLATSEQSAAVLPGAAPQSPASAPAASARHVHCRRHDLARSGPGNRRNWRRSRVGATRSRYCTCPDRPVWSSGHASLSLARFIASLWAPYAVRGR